MRYLAYTRATRPTGRDLAKELGVDFGIRNPKRRLDALVRWGSCRLMPPAAITLNRAGAIALASDKIQAIHKMKAAGVACITCFPTMEEARAAAPEAVILGRSRTGMGGSGIVAYEPGQEYDWSGFDGGHDWYSIYERPTREVRLHVVRTSVIRVQGKYLDFPEDAESSPYVRNHRAGYRFRAPKLKLHSRRMEQAIRAVRSLGLDFGAVDMLLFGSERESLVLEVNTAPSCSPKTLSAYSAAISRLL